MSLCLLVAGGCRSVDPGASAGETAPALSVPQGTTRGDIALGNLSSRIEGLERRLAARPAEIEKRGELVSSLISRSHFQSRFDDLRRIEELTEDLPETRPGPEAHLLRARARAAVHRFPEARADLARARELGAKENDTAALGISIQVALGEDLPRALAAAKQRATADPTLEHLVSWAMVEAALGQFESAEEHYILALRGYRDISPFPVAQILFQRGVMWAEMAAEPARALPLYAEAVRRLPQYVVANVHLAELEIGSGRREAARKRLESLARESDDPEVLALLAEERLHAGANDAEARALVERARSRYEALLGQHRLAFLDHAAEFFAGPGRDARRALNLALDNLALRPTARAHEIVIEAALAAGDRTVACAHLQRSRPLGAIHKNLATLVEREAGHCAGL